MRWLWNDRGYTVDLTPDDADELMRELGRYSEYGEANLNNFAKTLSRIFAYLNREKGRNYGWECDLKIKEDGVTDRAYFTKDEFRPLYEAALEHGTVKHYNTCTPDERDELKAHLTQRFEKPKEAVSPEDFRHANSFKIPSLVSVVLDCGLRPIEVERSQMGWLNFEDNSLDIPKDESSKNTENWKCVLSEQTVHALRKWVDEQASYEKSADQNEIWLNKKGKPLHYELTELPAGAVSRTKRH